MIVCSTLDTTSTIECLQLLLKYGADSNLKNRQKYTFNDSRKYVYSITFKIRDSEKIIFGVNKIFLILIVNIKNMSLILS